MSDQTRVEGSGRAAGEALPAMIQGLLRPAAYTHAADDIQLHETHISWVVLAGEHVYKLKKPVNLGFLDFTTRQRRAQDCTDEVRLNRRLSPDVYLGLVEIVERDGAFIVSGPGSGGEPAVHMRRLPAGGMLPALLARGQVDVPLVQRIARLLARFHARAATGAGIDEYGSPSVVRANWAENFSQMATFVGRTIQTEINAAIWLAVSRLLDDQQALLASRVAHGRIRDGHGDLHAASICIDGGRILLFDCLQFAPRFRCSDVAAEVAFLAMDLEHHGRAHLAWAFVNAYVRASGDAELWRLLDFYVCYRA